MFRAILFDIDGTLINTRGAGVRAFIDTFDQDFGIPNAAHNISFAGRTDRSIVAEIFAAHRIARSTLRFQQFYAGYLPRLDQELLKRRGQICPGVRGLLRQLRKHTPPPVIGLLTGNIPGGAERKLRRFDLWNEFEMGAFGERFSERDQIAAHAFRTLRRKLGRTLRPEHVLIIGDTPRDIQCARAIGAKVLAVATGDFTTAQLRNHKPDLVVPTLRQVTMKRLFEVQ